jgi:hypothetical protein
VIISESPVARPLLDTLKRLFRCKPTRLAGVSTDDDVLIESEIRTPCGKQSHEKPDHSRGCGWSGDDVPETVGVGIRHPLAGGSRHASHDTWADSDKASAMRRMPGPSCGLRCRQSRGALLRARILSLPKLQVRSTTTTGTNGSPCALRDEPILDLRANVMVRESRHIPATSTEGSVRRSVICGGWSDTVRREGPTRPDPANALSYGINLRIHTMRNESPSQPRFNGSSSVVHRTAFHNPMPSGVLVLLPSRMASTQGRFQRAGVAVNE